MNILDYEPFKNTFYPLLMNGLSGKNITAKIISIKSSDETYDSLVITHSNNFHHNFQLKQLYSYYVEAKLPLYKLVNQILSIIDEFEKNLFSINPNSIVFELRNPKSFAKDLQHFPHMIMHDMVILFTIEYMLSETVRSYSYITNSMMKANGLTTEKLYNLAMTNTFRNHPSTLDLYSKYRLNLLYQILPKDQPLSEEQNSEVLKCLMVAQGEKGGKIPLQYILSSQNYSCGSTAILNTPYLDEQANKFDCNLLLFSISQSFFILIPWTKRVNLQTYKEAFKALLEEERDEILTKHILYYNRETKKVEILEE